MDALFSNEQIDINIIIDLLHNKSGINLSKGNENYQLGTGDYIQIDKVVSKELINNIIEFLIIDHDIISSFNLEKSRCIEKFDEHLANIDMEFQVNLCDENMKGIPCNMIGLKIEFNNDENCDNILNEYVNSIIKRFFNQLKHTSFIQE